MFGACQGACAEYVSAAADTLALKPANLGFEEAAAVPPPSPQDMFRYMYAEMTPQLIEQEAALLASLQQQGESHGTAHAR